MKGELQLQYKKESSIIMGTLIVNFHQGEVINSINSYIEHSTII